MRVKTWHVTEDSMDILHTHTHFPLFLPSLFCIHTHTHTYTHNLPLSLISLPYTHTHNHTFWGKSNCWEGGGGQMPPPPSLLCCKVCTVTPDVYRHISVITVHFTLCFVSPSPPLPPNCLAGLVVRHPP